MMVYKTVKAKHFVQKVVHMILQLGAFVLGVIGICAVFKFHDMANIEDVYSLHSWIGITTISLFALQVKEKPKNSSNFPTIQLQNFNFQPILLSNPIFRTIPLLADNKMSN